MMKNYISMAAVSLSLFLLAACSNSGKDGLETYAELQNKSCPQVVDGELILTDYDYSKADNVFALNYSVRELGGTVAPMRASEKPLRRIIGQNFHDESLRDLLGLLLEAEAEMRVRFIGEITGDTLDIDFTVADLNAIAADAGRELSDLERLESLVANENSRCPQYIDGDSLVISSMTIEEPYIVLTYSFDPCAYNFATLDSTALRERFEPGLRQILEAGAGREQLALMKKLHLGMRYAFLPTDSTAPFSVTIHPSEIAAYK